MGHGRIAPMGVLLLLVLPLTVSSQQEACKITGMPGIPGVPGLPGKDGRNGLKGDAGVPGLTTGPTGQQTAPGEVGGPGPIGKRGEQGEPGKRGLAGYPGPMGDDGVDDGGPVAAAVHSAFSVSRAVAGQPARSSPIIFSTVITNYNNDFNTDTGRFRCTVPGTYYFVYHASATERLCLQLRLDGEQLASWCDVQTRNTLRQVSSGGLAVYVKTGQEVWLETSDFRAMTSIPAGVSIFSGFLMHHHQ